MFHIPHESIQTLNLKVKVFMHSWKYPFVLIAFASLTDCAVNSQLEQDKAAKVEAKRLQKAKDDTGILERALARCRSDLPEPAEWPRVYSTGFYGDFWMKAPNHGRVLEMRSAPMETEEQVFIVSRQSKTEPVQVEGKNVRQLDAGIYAIILYKLPQDPEERKKSQTVIITYGDVRFVLLFKPSRRSGVSY